MRLRTDERRNGLITNQGDQAVPRDGRLQGSRVAIGLGNWLFGADDGEQRPDLCRSAVASVGSEMALVALIGWGGKYGRETAELD